MYLPKTFHNGGYDVTVNADRSIRVRPGDWLSKYSMAVYGDFKHVDCFMKKVGDDLYRPLDNPDLINVGQIVYHPERLPGEPKSSPGTKDPTGNVPFQAKYVADFLRWIYERFILSDWYVNGTSGGDASISFITGQYEQINITKRKVETTATLHAVALGFEVGWPEDFSIGGSFSVGPMPDIGAIVRFAWHRELELDDFRHGIIYLEFGTNFWFGVGGGNLALLIFGIGIPAPIILRAIRSYFQFGNRSMLESAMLKALPSGAMILAGTTIGIPGIGVAGRVGVMYDRGYFGI
ncbi:MAG TPA: hypothetical protein VLV76_23005 [Candidatus Acidoferrum sp.]|nr:hypothetical protein [Candidatus Acidoferrum sp.]